MAAATRMPLELWQRVFTFAATNGTDPHDYVEFWNTGRQVCHTWRLQIARTYLDLFVKNPSRCSINLDLGVDDMYYVDMLMVFDRLDPEHKSRCVFKESEETRYVPEEWSEEEKEEYELCKVGRWTERSKIYLVRDEEDAKSRTGHFDEPFWVLSLYGNANDTELPNLRMDYDKREISFEWEGMLTAFCLELAESSRRSSGRGKNLACQTRTSLTDPAQMAKNMLDAMRSLVGMMSNSLKDVRRHRIKKFYKEKYNVDFTDDMFDLEAESHQISTINHMQDLERDLEEDEDDIDESEGEFGYDDDGWISEDE